jgi:ectoine hydroxylase-related dioxygenase (phytanoyl-CoA dioxygenase family)
MTTVVLSSNGVEIPFDDAHFAPMRDSTAARNDPAELRRRFAANGYVRIRGLLDPGEVRAVRAAYFARFDPVLLAPGTTPEEGVFSGTVPDGLPPYGTAGHPAHDFVRTEQFDRFTSRPELTAVAGALLDGTAELMPRRILRHFDHRSAAASRAHVDWDYMDQGGAQVVTAWITLGDCPVECGGLVYLEGSHRADRSALDALRAHTDRPDDQRPVSNDLALTARALGGRWLWADHRAGDVVFHSPHLVHASLDNRRPVMRLSVDLRFRRRDAAADPRWSAPWSADDGF